MTHSEILEELKRLPAAERLKIIEAALQLLHEDLRQVEQSDIYYAQRKQRLAKAAEALRPDYLAGGELTAFTALDGEDFDAEGRNLAHQP